MPPTNNLHHRSKEADLNPHLGQTRKLLAAPMPGSPKPETLEGLSVALDADAPTPDPEPNADLVLQLQSTFPASDHAQPAFYGHPHFREAAHRQRHRATVDLNDEASRNILASANRPT